MPDCSPCRRTSQFSGAFAWKVHGKTHTDLYSFRYNILSDKESVKELRLNLGDFTAKDKKELVSYIKIEKSKKMKIIINYLFS